LGRLVIFEGGDGVKILDIFFILPEPGGYHHLPTDDPVPDPLLGLHMLVKILIIMHEKHTALRRIVHESISYDLDEVEYWNFRK
jgi:hypothetical protein